MSKISNESDQAASVEGSKNTELCPLISYGCMHDPKSTSRQVHFTTEKHQEIIVKLAQQILVQSENQSTTDLNEADKDEEDEYFKKISTIIELLENVNDNLVESSAVTLQLRNQLIKFEDSINSTTINYSSEESFINAIRLNNHVLKSDCLELKRKVESKDNGNMTHILDGTMIWKIDNVREKMYDAQSERQTSIYSPEFYSSTQGYKLCMRLYLHGDGTSRGTHLSLFIVVLRGPYDALLQWPFSYRVSFCLFDQRSMIESATSRQPKHIIQSFRPDTRSTSFQRPDSTMNIASGIPKFVSLEDFDQPPETNRYIINDTIFIKVFIDFRGIPKSISEYILTLNCALPVHIQQRLIDEKLKHCQEENKNQS